jgi:hypothetical protein
MAKPKNTKKSAKQHLHPSGKPYIVLKGLEGNPPAGELNGTQQALHGVMPVLVPFWAIVIGLAVLNIIRVVIRDARADPGEVWSRDPRA